MNSGVFYTALSAALYGCIGYYGVQLMQAGFSVCDMLLWRFLISLFMFLPIGLVIYKQKQPLNFKSILTLFLVSAIFYGGGTACYFEASKTIGTGLAMVLFFTYPLFVAILSILTKKAPTSWPTLISLMLIVLGSCLIAFGNGFDLTLDLYGLGVALASGLGYGLYVFGSKESSQSMPSLLSALIVCAGNTVAFTLFSVAVQGHFMLPHSMQVWMDLLLFALIGTVLPIFFLLRGMKSLSANKASIIGVLEPVAVLAVGYFILSEEVTWVQFLGAMVILLSVIVVQFEKDATTQKLLQA